MLSAACVQGSSPSRTNSDFYSDGSAVRMSKTVSGSGPTVLAGQLPSTGGTSTSYTCFFGFQQQPSSGLRETEYVNWLSTGGFSFGNWDQGITTYQNNPSPIVEGRNTFGKIDVVPGSQIQPWKGTGSTSGEWLSSRDSSTGSDPFRDFPRETGFGSEDVKNRYPVPIP